MSTFVKLGKRVVENRSKPYVIAEIGVNHGGSLERAKHLIDQAQQGGADAAKFQSYKAGKLASTKLTGILGYFERTNPQPIQVVSKA